MDREEWKVNPRPDLKGDVELWKKLFNIVEDDEELKWSLHGFRCCGTIIVSIGGKYDLKPIISEGNWKSDKEFKKTANKYLDRQEILELLSKLNS